MKNKINGLFFPLVATLFLCALLLTSNKLYSDYYGFEILIAFISFLNVLILPLILTIAINKIYLLIIFFHILMVLISTSYNFMSFPHALFYINLLLFFLVVLPSLNNSFTSFVRLLKFINNVIVILVSIFVILNLNLYLDFSFFASKDQYFKLLSNPNSIGFLVYVGFSVSLLLLTVEKEKIYRCYLFYYAVSLVLIPPVLTAYVSIFCYFFLFVFFKAKGLLRFFLITTVGLSLVFGVYSFSVAFEEFRFLLSYRDVLFLNSFDKIAAAPIFGYGIENWGYLFLDMKNPHNFFLYQFLSFGVLGAVFYFLIFLWVAHIAYQKYRNSERSNFYLHILIQIIVCLMVMSVFVSMPGNYQDISILLSIIVAVFFNASLRINTSS